ncbi:hypothetical protein N7488_001544 [Penicillium malachiteum]|nr:hypothetical protein N7488_001544 [Penicillium malachiteum]
MTDNPELESFRRQWREEVSGRSEPRGTPQSVRDPHSTRFSPSHHAASHRRDLEEEGAPPASFDTEDLAQQVGQLSVEPEKAHEDDKFVRQDRHEPNSALEHFERAVEKEAAGNLGDSLQHYRKAYRLDASVDKTYRNKHFAHVWKKPAQPASTGSKTVSAPVPAPPKADLLPTKELIESFANLPIPQAEPAIENTSPPPCPIANLPSEVIVELLRHVSLRDPATFGRMALVCKRFAYHFSREQHIWKRICQNPEFGFAGMHYTYACDILGNPIFTLNGTRYTPFPMGVSLEIPNPLSSWSQVFQSYPRIRFTGIYISTVNYTRPGAQSTQTVTWNTPIHIVTYYRYLRFYPDGTVVSLLSTTEPVDVVPYISKENLKTARATSHKQHQRRVSDQGHSLSGANDPLPPVAMNALQHGHRGRWRLTSPVPLPEDEYHQTAEALNQTPESDDPRDVFIETEGVEKKYIYLMQLSLRSTSASKSQANQSKNTKLVWRGFWNYNKLTDDLGEFGLRNDRAFVFSRVRGWGLDGK